MNFAENFENLAKAFYNASATIKNFAEAVREAEKAANRPGWPKTYFERKRKKEANNGSRRVLRRVCGEVQAEKDHGRLLYTAQRVCGHTGLGLQRVRH